MRDAAAYRLTRGERREKKRQRKQRFKRQKRFFEKEE
jgi:hypothetical protein